ncbi:ribonuclease BN (tRNA processing enzyme) [Acidovorax sp. 62]|uniref:MBL fold metallo-hydrolase n=1 Tax=Acidovorax sp. 62 TaxID=2035203 RepID=UPI000C17475D|nr:3',5'-cyclic-nucleotide phosphodiesterase [Acidovorax sp. 62]PIF92561.1 ribonuclease BN (tRNA processing enzyme) [Acidovorax sp. 62]
MRVRVLGCSGAIARDCRTTSFLVNHNILIDAGTGVGDLTLDEMCQIDHVFLTHSHLDHVAALPLMLDAVSSLRGQPVQVHALAATIAALQAHIFNNVIWPDFSRIPSAQVPFLQYRPVAEGDVIQVEGALVSVLPAVHTVPAVGYAVQGSKGWWAFSGDTERNPGLWRQLEQLPQLKPSLSVGMLVIETAFSNRESELARRSLHLSPTSLAAELAQGAAGASYPIYITHTKPSETDLILQEINQMGLTAKADIHWLQAGQVFDV